MQIKGPCLSDKDGDSITFTQFLYNMNDVVTFLITIKPMTKITSSLIKKYKYQNHVTRYYNRVNNKLCLTDRHAANIT